MRTREPLRYTWEEMVKRAVCAWLRDLGVSFEREVSVVAGRVDIVTNNTVYEIKRFLTVPAVVQGIGQLLAYSSFLTKKDSKKRQLVLLGQPGKGLELVPLLEELGIRWIVFKPHGIYWKKAVRLLEGA